MSATAAIHTNETREASSSRPPNHQAQTQSPLTKSGSFIVLSQHATKPVQERHLKTNETGKPGPQPLHQNSSLSLHPLASLEDPVCDETISSRMASFVRDMGLGHLNCMNWKWGLVIERKPLLGSFTVSPRQSLTAGLPLLPWLLIASSEAKAHRSNQPPSPLIFHVPITHTPTHRHS